MYQNKSLELAWVRNPIDYRQHLESVWFKFAQQEPKKNTSSYEVIFFPGGDKTTTRRKNQTRTRIGTKKATTNWTRIEKARRSRN